jgi:hypothetical protein
MRNFTILRRILAEGDRILCSYFSPPQINCGDGGAEGKVRGGSDQKSSPGNGSQRSLSPEPARLILLLPSVL